METLVGYQRSYLVSEREVSAVSEPRKSTSLLARFPNFACCYSGIQMVGSVSEPIQTSLYLKISPPISRCQAPNAVDPQKCRSMHPYQPPKLHRLTHFVICVPKPCYTPLLVRSVLTLSLDYCERFIIVSAENISCIGAHSNHSIINSAVTGSYAINSSTVFNVNLGPISK